MTTKSDSARMVAAGRAIETFQHETLGHFNVTEIRRIIGTYKQVVIHTCRFDEVRMVDGMTCDPLQYLIGAREIDWVHVGELTDKQIEEPLIFLHCPPGSNGQGESHLLVDGIHRMCARHKRGFPDFKFHVFPLLSAPIIDERLYRHLPWGEKELIPGVGLVARKR